jgi:hypothetical protein
MKYGEPIPIMLTEVVEKTPEQEIQDEAFAKMINTAQLNADIANYQKENPGASYAQAFAKVGKYEQPKSPRRFY